MSGSDAARRRRSSAALLIHAITGDSWGVQAAAFDADEGYPNEHGFAPLYRAFWEAGELLRTHLPGEHRDRLVEALRAAIVAAEAEERG